MDAGLSAERRAAVKVAVWCHDERLLRSCCTRGVTGHFYYEKGQRVATMIVGRVIGWLVLLAGLSVLTRDVMVWIDRKIWAPVALGQLWYELSRSSLNLVQAEIQRYISPFLWNPVIVTILLCWAFAVLITLGAAILFIFRNRPPRSS